VYCGASGSNQAMFVVFVAVVDSIATTEQMMD